MIVATEIESVHGAPGQRRLVFYRCQDSEGVWHPYGPVNAAPDFDETAFMPTVAARVAASLADEEFSKAIAP